MAAPGDPSSQPVPFGPFLLEKRLAVGGSAEVFLARPKIGSNPAPHFVVKRLLESARDPNQFDTLQHEAELHNAVDHPNVVRVFGAGMVDKEPYLAMEYVEGVDLYRLLRRAESEQRPIPHELAAFVAREVALALTAVHSAKRADGTPLSIVHRDVTPSNVYLSVDGVIKLGDFGIARVAPTLGRSQSKAGLKGKFGYLAPEQVAGEPFDHRADLFSLGVILGEMLARERIFPGEGQLAVLLAIRDVNVEPLERVRAQIDPKLYAVCQKALERDPSRRVQDASQFAEMLGDAVPIDAEESAVLLSRWVRWARDSSQLTKRLQGQIRDSVERMRAVRMASGQVPASQNHGELAPKVTLQGGSEAAGTSLIRFSDGRLLHDIGFARLVEMVATGDLHGDDEVQLPGQSFVPIRNVESLARHLLPSTTATTGRLFQPGVPDYHALLDETPMLHVLARLRSNRRTGALFVELRDSAGTSHRKEVYLLEGRLHYVASTEKRELLGEYLIRRGAIERQQLEVALHLVSQHGGGLGDTLIAMGVVDAVDVFRAIRDQGRDRVAALCAWRRGTVSFYRDTMPNRVEFPLDLDLANAMMAGAIVAARSDVRGLLPDDATLLSPGLRAEAAETREERGSAPTSLQRLPLLAAQGLSIGEALHQLTATPPDRAARTITDKEAAAALVVGKVLGWIDF